MPLSGTKKQEKTGKENCSLNHGYTNNRKGVDMLIEIYFDDLNEDGKKKVLDALGITSPEDANLDVVPIFVYDTEG